MDSSAPNGSKAGRRSSWDEGTSRAPATRATATTTTLIRNTEPHQKCWSSHPLTTPPEATPTPANPAHTAMARRRSDGGNTWASTDRVAGITRAAPTPMAARAVMSRPEDPENTANPDAAPKITRPLLSASLRPNRSPRLPAVSRRPANTRL